MIRSIDRSVMKMCMYAVRRIEETSVFNIWNVFHRVSDEIKTLVFNIWTLLSNIWPTLNFNYEKCYF